MRGVEESLAQAGFETIAGVDEAGRGALAGPVTAAAVVLPAGGLIPGIDDSKQLSPSRREELAEVIRREAVAWAVVSASAGEVDRTNILRAVKRIMADALNRLDPRPDLALVDAVRLPRLGFPTLGLVRGDAICYSIAAASILAKTEHDRELRALDERYPQYGFAGHVGYGSKPHREALAVYGPCPEHRLTFRGVVPRKKAA